MFKSLLILITGICLSSSAMVVVAEDPFEVVTTREGKVTNYCVGGGDDHKLIPFDGVIRNPFRETTHFGCESEGGTATFMPDLDPVIKDGKLV
ncbi:MAG: hypothetical protein FJ194_01775 [Gammaproteobacteria bacterium]|nr:hypothetical protein [Gammaproteobacteria bacterium]